MNGKKFYRELHRARRVMRRREHQQRLCSLLRKPYTASRVEVYDEPSCFYDVSSSYPAKTS